MKRKLHLSRRVESVLASPIRKFLPLALAAEQRGIEVLRVNVGDSDIPVPKVFWRALRSFRDRNIGYAPSPGIPQHTRAWVKYYATLGVKLRPQDIIPTVGCAEAMLFALLGVADPGDEVLVFEPVYPSYKGFAAMLGIRLVPVTLSVENNFALPPAATIAKKITRKTRAIVVINPNNPTGAVLTKQETARIIQLAKKYHLFIIADETYREIVFQGKPTSFLQSKSAREHVIALDSMSKKFSCPGVRIGAIVSRNAEVMRNVLRVAMVRLSAPTLEQWATIPLLEHAATHARSIAREYQRRRQVVYSALKKMPGVTVRQPAGALYIIAALPIANTEDFVKFLLTEFHYRGKTALVTPAADFYITPGLGRNQIRIAYVLNAARLRQVMEVLERGLQAYRQKYGTA
ncbi:MAG: pyridoxal phosphate-dependent aminotransferase [Patescibacteria group bacterium]|nr:pyridoxal phosphate-dependent aminotransferase [Patescibacteria group bacterium]